MQHRFRPDRFRNRTLKERRNDQIRIKQTYRFLCHAIVHIELDRQLMTARDKLDIQALSEAVKRVRKQQSAH